MKPLWWWAFCALFELSHVRGFGWVPWAWTIPADAFGTFEGGEPGEVPF